MDNELEVLYSRFLAHKENVLEELASMEMQFPKEVIDKYNKQYEPAPVNAESFIRFSRVLVLNIEKACKYNKPAGSNDNPYRLLYNVYRSVLDKIKSERIGHYLVNSIKFHHIVKDSIQEVLSDSIYENIRTNLLNSMQQDLFSKYNTDLATFADSFSALLKESKLFDENLKGLTEKFIKGMDAAIRSNFTDKEIMFMTDTESTLPLIYILLCIESWAPRIKVTSMADYKSRIVQTLNDYISSAYVYRVADVMYDYIQDFMLKEEPNNVRLELSPAFVDYQVGIEDILPLKTRLLNFIKGAYLSEVYAHYDVETKSYLDNTDEIANAMLYIIRNSVVQNAGKGMTIIDMLDHLEDKFIHFLSEYEYTNVILEDREVIIQLALRIKNCISEHLYFDEPDKLDDIFFFIDSAYPTENHRAVDSSYKPASKEVDNHNNSNNYDTVSGFISV